MILWFLFFLLPASLCLAIDCKQFNNEFEIGYQGAVGLRENGVTRNLPYFYARTTYSPDIGDNETTIYAFDASLRTWYEFGSDGDDRDFQIRSLFFDATGDKWSLKSGFQEIAWGETFGLFIADLVNPRDLTDPFFNELAWIRIPVFTINAQFFHEPWSLQFVFTPIPMNNWLPPQGSPWDVVPTILQPVPLLGPHKFAVDRCGKDAEYAVKAGYLFESGLDVSMFYFRHWNRDPVYRLRINEKTGLPFLKPVLHLIETVGASYSKAFDQMVLRGDSVIHIREPWTVGVFGVVKRRTVWRTILGMDFTTEKDFSFGFQYHLDHWREGTLHSFSTRFMQDFCKGKFRFEIFLYLGLNNRDQWIQPQLTWNINESWEASLRGDFFDGKTGDGSPKQGFIGPFRNKDRLFLWVRHQF